MKENINHPEIFVSQANAIHKCVMTYLNMTSNMPPKWYIQNVYDSCNRKGYTVTLEEVIKYFILYKPQYKGKCVIQNGNEYINL